MKLLTREIANKLPTLDETAQTPISELTVYWKLFNPCGSGTWYIYAYNPDEKIAMGFANLGDPVMAELGTVDINELEKIQIPPFGMKIERDMGFSPMPLQEVIDKVKSGEHI